MESPGTVSRILWHFTGGPKWDREKDILVPKTLEEAFAGLKAILESKVLKISNYTEPLIISAPGDIYINKETGKRFHDEDEVYTVGTSPICCLSDIPLQHLPYHAKRYGKCAIGFYRESAIRHGFNPVLYTLRNSAMLNAVFDGLSQISYSNLQDRFGFIYDFKDEEPESNLEDYIDDLYHNVDSALQDILDSTVKISSFIKAFRTDEFNTVYSEREWRALSPFYFNEKDIAFIIVPKQKGCYKELCRSGNLWGKIPVLPWEDLLEY